MKIASCSFGKDSIATILLISNHDAPICGICCCNSEKHQIFARTDLSMA